MSGTSPARLQARALTVGYRTGRTTRTVLSDVTVAADRGTLVCLLGPNGIGKSTLLRTLARMQPPLGGTIELDGRDLRSLSGRELARTVAVVLTERVVVDALSARRVVEFGRYPHSGWFGVATDADRDVIERSLAAVGASALADREFNQLSDGERQRVMIARALAQEPTVLLLDEPTAFLDISGRRELMQLLRRLAHDEGLTVVASTHELELALRSADVLWIAQADGRLIAGAPADLVLGGTIAAAFSGTGSRAPTRTEGVMKSISTTRGDSGETSLAGEVRVSKASAQVDTYGTVDELAASIGFARSICDDREIAAFAKTIQIDLFTVGAALATPDTSPKPAAFDPALVDRLTSEVHRIEAIEGILSDWSVPGDHRAAAAFDVARTVCRRAERAVVRFQESGAHVPSAIVAYLNRLSDVLWLFGRKLERDAGISSSVREATDKAGNPFSKAW